MYCPGFLVILVGEIGTDMSALAPWKWKSPMSPFFKAFQGFLDNGREGNEQKFGIIV